MHVLRANLNGNPNIGLFCYCNNSFCLVPRGTSEKTKKMFEEVLKVPVFDMNIAGTSLLGVFIVGNKNSILIPEISFPNEKTELENHKIAYSVINSELTALGNNLLCNDNCCIINPDYNTAAANQIRQALKVPVKKGRISELNIIGSLCSLNNKYGLISNEALEFEKKFLKANLKVRLTEGTVNFGSPYISSGVICNQNGFVIGEISSGPEIANADEAFGYIDKKGD